MTLWRRIVIAQVVIGLVLALALPLLIDRTIRGIGDDLTGRFLAGEADRWLSLQAFGKRKGETIAAGNEHGAVAIYLLDSKGVHRLSGPSIPDEAALSGLRGADGRLVHGPRSDLVGRSTSDGNTVVAAEDRGHPAVLSDDIISHFLERFSIIVPLALLCSTAACLFVLRHALNPLRRSADEARRIDAVNPGVLRLDERAVPAEILPLVHAANELLERAAGDFERERTFSATVVHELRTALATISLRAELVAADPASRDALMTAIERASRVVSQMLELHGRRGELATGTPVAVGVAAREIVGALEPLAGRDGHLLVCRAAGATGVPRLASENLVTVTLHNVVENAIRHAVPGGTIEVAFDDAAATVSVADAGPGIRVRETSDGRKVYSRADGGGSNGAGLGLAIVTRLMESASGSIAFAGNARGGTTVTLHYPAATRP